jgi:hypothetical protein
MDVNVLCGGRSPKARNPKVRFESIILQEQAQTLWPLKVGNLNSKRIGFRLTFRAF